MDGPVHIEISWRKLICLAGALLVMGAPILASFCATGDCAVQSSKAEANCSSEMSMVQSATSINAQSRIECCQITQGPPATLRQSIETEKAKVEFLSTPLGTGLPSVISKSGIIAGPADNAQPADVQSSICTFRI